MRILIVSFYYEPDLSAGSFRTTAFVQALACVAPATTQIDVITTQPNRYRSFSADAASQEHRPGLSVYRVKLPKHQSGVLDQSVAFASFARAAVAQAAAHDYDVVFATSGRLMTAALGAFIARQKRAPLYLDIRDIFVDTISDLLLSRMSWIAKPGFSALERWTVNRATRVNLVSRGFEPYFSTRYPAKRFSYVTNGIDQEFLDAAPTQAGPLRKVGDGKPITVLYAGNVGQGQGLHQIIPQLAARLGSGVKFRVIGDGGRRAELETRLKKNGILNVEVLPPVSRDALMQEYRNADVLFLQLGDFPALTTVIPSKLFEYAALGKPIWAGVAGFTATFVKAEISNSAVFHPCDAEEALRVFDDLLIQESPRTEFCQKYSRAKLSHLLAHELLAVACESGVQK